MYRTIELTLSDTSLSSIEQGRDNAIHRDGDQLGNLGSGKPAGATLHRTCVVKTARNGSGFVGCNGLCTYILGLEAICTSRDGLLLLEFLLLLLFARLLEVVAIFEIICSVVLGIEFSIVAIHASDRQVAVVSARTISIGMWRCALHAAIGKVALPSSVMQTLTSMALDSRRLVHFFDPHSAVADGVHVQQHSVLNGRRYS